MDLNYKVITLCGSARFKQDFLNEQQRLTLDGNIVLMPVFFENVGEQIIFSDEIKLMLDNMHKRKIDMSDEVYVINKNGYIGSSTLCEIDYATSNGKKVNYMEN